jgi:flagellar biogenesis protein FliO
MNQFSKYRFIATVATSAASKWVGHSVVSTVFALAVTLVFGSCNLSAQQTQNFAPPRDAFTSVRNSTAQNQNGWQQPANIQTSNHLPQATRLKPPSNAWPAEPVTFDSQVSHAKFESGVSSLDSANENQSTTLQTTLASSGAMLAYVKDGLLAKAGEMFGGDKSQPSKLNITKMLSSLAIVLGGYFAFVWVVRKFNPGANSQLPPDVVQVLGKTPFGTRQTLQVVRLGSKLVLLLNGADGTFPMGEVTDPDEVNRLTAMCNHRGARGRDGSLSSSIGNSLSQHIQTKQPPRAVPQPTGEPQFDYRPAASPAPVQSEQVTVGKETLNGLANILRSIDSASKQNSPSVFEA